jgi:hypothetical protein
MRSRVGRRAEVVLSLGAVFLLGLLPAKAETGGRIRWQYETGG